MVGRSCQWRSAKTAPIGEGGCGDCSDMEHYGRQFEAELVWGRVADNSVAAGEVWNVADTDWSLLLRNNLQYRSSSNR